MSDVSVGRGTEEEEPRSQEPRTIEEEPRTEEEEPRDYGYNRLMAIGHARTTFSCRPVDLVRISAALRLIRSGQTEERLLLRVQEPQK